MKNQIHIRVPDTVIEQVRIDAGNQGKSIQEYIEKILVKHVLNNKNKKETKSLKGKKRYRFIDLFAGIGGIRLAFERAGGECVFTSEYDRFCQETYFANFNEIPDGDIRKISEKNIPDHDILVAGFPCQPFSIAGVSKKNSLGRNHGFLDKTQGTLFFDILRIINYKRPDSFLLENVKNLRAHDKGNTFKVIIDTLEKSGYSIFYKVMDGKHYTPQHRERIFIAGFNKHKYKKIDFNFPVYPDENQKLKYILESEVDDKYTLSNKLWDYLQAYSLKHKKKGNGFGYSLVNKESISRTLSARYYKDGSEILIPQDKKNPRKLTPRECARLQGFPDNFKIPVSNTQAYKQFGNSVVVPLVEDVAKTLIATLNNYECRY
ncbi:MAG: DNA (cytosine-5-)-methyltransferase [bacterium]|nr:DNA (cytosine-5-)-methyltransferase [bacterium]